jgi:hypothetical protein
LYLQVAQKNTSEPSLDLIVTFFKSLNTNLILSGKPLGLNVTTVINKKTNVISLGIHSIDALYYYVLPFLDNNTMYAHKQISFKL